jgi:hypothetical protein
LVLIDFNNPALKVSIVRMTSLRIHDAELASFALRFCVAALDTGQPASQFGPRPGGATAGDRFAFEVVLYDAKVSLPFGPRLLALPIQTLWATSWSVV